MPEVTGLVEWAHFTATFDFELRRGWTVTRSPYDGRHGYLHLGVDECVVTSIEGTTLNEVDKAALGDCELEIFHNDRSILRQSLVTITPHDSVLEARVRRLENLVDGILSTELDDQSQDAMERRMAQRRTLLTRLGWQPYDPVDHRRLRQPILVKERETFRCQVTCGAAVPEEPVIWRLSLMGTRKLLIL